MRLKASPALKGLSMLTLLYMLYVHIFFLRQKKQQWLVNYVSKTSIYLSAAETLAMDNETIL